MKRFALNLICILSAFYCISQDSNMDNQKIVEINQNLLGKSIFDYDDYFVKVTHQEARKRLIISYFKHFYSGNEQLKYLDHPVKEFGLKVKNGVIQKFILEIPYNNSQIFYDIIEHLGEPSSLIPKEPPFLDTKENVEYYKQYGFENCIEFGWYDIGEDFFITLDNYIEENKCYPGKEKVVWITYSLVKNL